MAPVVESHLDLYRTIRGRRLGQLQLPPIRLKCDWHHSFLPPFVLEVSMTSCRVGDDMTPKPRKLALILAAVLAVAALITINMKAVANNENGWRALSAPGTIHRSGLVNLY